MAKTTYTQDEYDEIANRLEETRKAQSGSDREVARLKQELDATRETKTKNAENAENAEIAALLDARAKDLDRRERVISLATERGIDAETAMNLILGDDDEERLETLAQTVKQARQEGAKSFAGENGRTVKAVSLDRAVPKSYDELIALSDAQLDRLDPHTVSAAIDQGMQAQRQTLRQRILEGLKR